MCHVLVCNTCNARERSEYVYSRIYTYTQIPAHTFSDNQFICFGFFVHFIVIFIEKTSALAPLKPFFARAFPICLKCNNLVLCDVIL